MSKVTLRDIVDGTPKGQKAVDKAIKQSIQDQNEMSKKAKNSPSKNKVSAAPTIVSIKPSKKNTKIINKLVKDFLPALKSLARK